MIASLHLLAGCDKCSNSLELPCEMSQTVGAVPDSLADKLQCNTKKMWSKRTILAVRMGMRFLLRCNDV